MSVHRTLPSPKAARSLPRLLPLLAALTLAACGGGGGGEAPPADAPAPAPAPAPEPEPVPVSGAFAAPTMFAGSPTENGCVDGASDVARFGSPQGIALDESGTVFVADTACNAVRKITPAGVVSTVAGVLGVPGDRQGVQSATRFSEPFGLAYLASSQRLFVTDRVGRRAIRINPSNGDTADETSLTLGLAFNRVTSEGPQDLATSERNIPLGISLAPTGQACMGMLAGASSTGNGVPVDGVVIDDNLLANDPAGAGVKGRTLPTSVLGPANLSLGPAVLSLVPSLGIAECVFSRGFQINVVPMRFAENDSDAAVAEKRVLFGLEALQGQVDDLGVTARFFGITGLAPAIGRSAYVADTNAIRLIDFSNDPGRVTTLVPNLSAPFAPTRQLASTQDGRTLYYTTRTGVVKLTRQ